MVDRGQHVDHRDNDPILYKPVIGYSRTPLGELRRLLSNTNRKRFMRGMYINSAIRGWDSTPCRVPITLRAFLNSVTTVGDGIATGNSYVSHFSAISFVTKIFSLWFWNHRDLPRRPSAFLPSPQERLMPIKYPIPPPSKWRLHSLTREKHLLWGTVHNPEGLRLGNKILKARFRAQVIENYYPPQYNYSPKKLARLFPGLRFQDEATERWEDSNYRRRKRGKGPPPKYGFRFSVRVDANVLQVESCRCDARTTEVGGEERWVL